jgi:hypothetical protein
MAIAAATTVLLLQQSLVWSDPPQSLVLGSILVLAGLAAADPVSRAISDRRRRIGDERRRNIEALLTQTMLRVADTTNVDCEALGLHAYVVKQPILSYFRLSDEFLEQIARVHLATVPVPSAIRWTRHKGVVGACWATGREISVNLDEVQGPYADSTAEQWALLPEDVTYNLSFIEFRVTVGKYGCVVATPIVDSVGKVVGCVSLDGPSQHCVALSTSTVHRMLRDAADSIAGHLPAQR